MSEKGKQFADGQPAEHLAEQPEQHLAEGAAGRREVLRALFLTGIACLFYAINSGVRGNYGIIRGAIAENCGLEYASLSFVLAISQLTFGIMQPVFGVAAIKKSNVFALRCGILLITAGVFLLPFCKSMAALLAVLGILIPSGTAALAYGIIMGTITPLLSPGVVPAVSGIVSASSGIGSAVFSPVLQAATAAFGLTGASVFLGVPAVLLLPFTVCFARMSAADTAAKRNLDSKTAQDSETAQTSKTEPVSETTEYKTDEGDSMKLSDMLKEALKNRDYLFLMVGFFTCGFHMAIIETHLYIQITSYGLSQETAAFAFSVYGIATILGSALSGFLCGRFPMKNVLGTLYASRILWVLAFVFLPKTLALVYVFLICLGLTGGATVPPTSGITSHLYGAKKLAALFGIVFFCHQVGSFFSAGFGGLLVSSAGGYTSLWMVDAVLCGMAAMVSYRIRVR